MHDRKIAVGSALCAAFAAALSLAAVNAPAEAAGKVKCYGVSKAGENDCANQAGTHSCAGQTKVSYDGGDWKGYETADKCMADGGKTEPFKGMNPAKKA
jgi:uncharacterized membrane protein